MSTWRIAYSRQAQKDAKKLATSGLKPKAKALLDVIAEHPSATPPRHHATRSSSATWPTAIHDGSTSSIASSTRSSRTSTSCTY